MGVKPKHALITNRLFVPNINTFGVVFPDLQSVVDKIDKGLTAFDLPLQQGNDSQYGHELIIESEHHINHNPYHAIEKGLKDHEATNRHSPLILAKPWCLILAIHISITITYNN